MDALEISREHEILNRDYCNQVISKDEFHTRFKLLVEQAKKNQANEIGSQDGLSGQFKEAQ